MTLSIFFGPKDDLRALLELQGLTALVPEINQWLPDAYSENVTTVMEWIADLGEKAKPFVDAFLKRIIREPNAITAKSFLFLYSYIDCYYAYTQLCKVKSSFRWDLQTACTTAITRLKDRFKTRILLEEFCRNLHNQRHANFLCQTLIQNPDEETKAFFLQRIIHNPFEENPVILAAVERVFNCETQPILISFLEEWIENHSKWMEWCEFAHHGTLSAIGTLSGGSEFKQKSELGLDPALDGLKIFLNCPSAWWGPLESCLRAKLEKEPIFLEPLIAAMKASVMPPPALLSVARAIHRNKPEANELANLVVLLNDHPWKRTILAILLMGSRSSQELDFLLEQLQQESSTKNRLEILNQMTHFELATIPDFILEMLWDPNQMVLCSPILQIIGNSNQSHILLPMLLEKPEPDALLIFQSLTHLPKLCPIDYLPLLKKPDPTPPYIEHLLDYLRAKNHPDLLQLASPFFTDAYPYIVWFSALKAILSAGKERMEALKERLHLFPNAKKTEVLCSALQVIRERPTLMMRPDKGHIPDDWRFFLDFDSPQVQSGALAILVQEDPLDFSEVEEWIHILDKMESLSASAKTKAQTMQLLGRLKQTTNPLLPATLAKFQQHVIHFNSYHQARWIKILALGHSGLWTELGLTTDRSFKTFLEGSVDRFWTAASVLKDLAQIIAHGVHLETRDLLKKIANHPNPAVAFFAQRCIEETPQSQKVQSIYIVDDSVVFCKTISRFLSHIGYEALHPKRVDQALDEISQMMPHVVIMDYLLGPFTGVELAKNLVNAGFKGTFIFITSNRHPDIEFEIKTNFECPLLFKPFPFSQLIEAIKGFQGAADSLIGS